MSVFEEKLATLTRTIGLASTVDRVPLSDLLRTGAGRRCFAVGSGGSIVAAAFLARCRGTLGLGETTVATPMELVLGDLDVRGADVWLFSAGASNPDIEAARRRCAAEGAHRVVLVTTRGDGRTAVAVAAAMTGTVVALPVADPKDGFLATHSLVAATTALLLAANDVAATDPATISDETTRRSELALAPGSDVRAAVRDFTPGDTVIVLHDPQAATPALLIETSLWETGIASVQRVDFRNFAHGRHVWLARHPDRTFVLAITARESRDIWAGISAALPERIRRSALDLGNAGRLHNAVGVATGLAIVDELGRMAGIDPGRPGRGDFATTIYEHAGLVDLAEEFTPATTHKRAANLRADPVPDRGVCLFSAFRTRRDRLEAAEFGALALDYDGTIVATDRRFEPPDDAIVAELVRLVDGGLRLGIATGRGGSAGDALRSALPARLHDRILVGYYNGAHILPLATPVEDSPPEPDRDVGELGSWLARQPIAEGRRTRRGPVQLTIDCDEADADRLSAELARNPAVSAGRLKVARSQHSVDVVPSAASKLRLVAALATSDGGQTPDVLAVGDSGAPSGNDHELLSGATSISVGQVCGDPEGCWTLFGDGVTGPDALHRILQSIRIDSGRGRLDLSRHGAEGRAA